MRDAASGNSYMAKNFDTLRHALSSQTAAIAVDKRPSACYSRRRIRRPLMQAATRRVPCVGSEAIRLRILLLVINR